MTAPAPRITCAHCGHRIAHDGTRWRHRGNQAAACDNGRTVAQPS